MDIEILKIASDTKNHKVLDNCTHKSKQKNPLCGDEELLDLIASKDNADSHVRATRPPSPVASATLGRSTRENLQQQCAMANAQIGSVKAAKAQPPPLPASASAKALPTASAVPKPLAPKRPVPVKEEPVEEADWDRDDSDSDMRTTVSNDTVSVVGSNVGPPENAQAKGRRVPN